MQARAVRNFAGPSGMVLRGEVIEVNEPYFTEWCTSGLIEPLEVVELFMPEGELKQDYKNRKKKV